MAKTDTGARRRLSRDRRRRQQRYIVGRRCAQNAVETAGKSLRDLRVAEVTKLDVKIEGGKVQAYRTRLQLSFKYEG